MGNGTSKRNRYLIYLAVERGDSVTDIATRFGLAASTIYRIHNEEYQKRGSNKRGKGPVCSVCGTDKNLKEVDRPTGGAGDNRKWLICETCLEYMSQRGPVRHKASPGYGVPCTFYGGQSR